MTTINTNILHFTLILICIMLFYHYWLLGTIFCLSTVWQMRLQRQFCVDQSICLAYKNDKKLTMTGNVWSDFTYFDICVLYKKLCIWSVIRFFCHTTSIINTRGYKKWIEMTIFDCYVDGMWRYSICIMTFLLWQSHVDVITIKNHITIFLDYGHHLCNATHVNTYCEFWLGKANFPSFFNLPKQIEHFGKIQWYLEGSCKRFIQTIKSEVKAL